MSVTVSQIKKRYPEPVQAGHGKPGSYCVLGAACRFYDSKVRKKRHEPQYDFPEAEVAASVLQKLNKRLDGKAVDYADRIIAENDDGEVTKAWDLLSRALSFGSKSCQRKNRPSRSK
jgi:hypothetical protein